MAYVNEKLALLKKFEQVLQEAAKERPKRQELGPSPKGCYQTTEPAWVAFERRALLDAVNLERRVRGLPQVTEAQVIRVENQAHGHVDYAHKYALYCAELAMGEDNPRP
jgi:hypothetical protein